MKKQYKAVFPNTDLLLNSRNSSCVCVVVGLRGPLSRQHLFGILEARSGVTFLLQKSDWRMANDIVLVDSDSDLESLLLQKLSYKKQKLGLFRKPFMSSDSLEEITNNDNDKQVGIDSVSESDSEVASDDNENEDNRTNGIFATNGTIGGVQELSLSSELSDNSSNGNSPTDNNDLNDIDSENGVDNNEVASPQSVASSSSSSDIDMVAPSSVDVVQETRRYLKTYGNAEFLQKYLPETATADDMLNLMAKLGYYPTQLIKHLRLTIPSANGSASGDGDTAEETPVMLDLASVVHVLYRVMERVKRKRVALEDFSTFDQVVKAIENSSNILVITGAGISTSLGIPDFRSSHGIYSKLEHLGLSDPQEVFDLSLFFEDPLIFYSVADMILPPDDIYSSLHAFIRVLQDQGKLLRNYTQNIDNLEANIGIRSDKLVQCHGSFATATCITCGYTIPGTEIYLEIRSKTIAKCPHCELDKQKALNSRKRKRKNGSDSDSDDDDDEFGPAFGVMKPDITFFGEPLPSRFHDLINKDLAECDLILCIGTSLKVAPVADIVDKVPASVPQILFNKDPILHCDFDVSLLGYCDDVAKYICDKLKWELPHKDTLIEGLLLMKDDERIYLIGNPEMISLSEAEAEAELNGEGEAEVEGEEVEEEEVEEEEVEEEEEQENVVLEEEEEEEEEERITDTDSTNQNIS